MLEMCAEYVAGPPVNVPRRTSEDLALERVPGEGPVELRALGSGLVNESYRVCRGGRLFWLRLPASHAEDLGLDRVWECRVLGLAAAAGVAPRVDYCDPASGVLIAEWTSGRPWTAAEIREPKNVATMAALLRRVHALPIPAPARVMSPGAWIALYAGAMGRRGLEPRWSLALRAGADERLRLLAARVPGLTLCHSDLHRDNLLVAGDRPVLIDWEYAHVSDPFWDLAAWTANNDWEADRAAELVERYLGRPARADELRQLGHMVWLYEYVCLLWSELYLSRRGGEAGGGGERQGAVEPPRSYEEPRGAAARDNREIAVRDTDVLAVEARAKALSARLRRAALLP